MPTDDAALQAAPVLTYFSFPTAVQLTGAGTPVPGLVGETGGSRLEEIDIQLDRSIALMTRAVAGYSDGIPPLEPVTTDVIKAYLPDELHAYSANSFFDLTADGATLDRLMFGTGASGTYHIAGLTLTDSTGASRSYDAAALTALGAPTSFVVTPDTTPPTLAALVLPTASPVLGDSNAPGAALLQVALAAGDPQGLAAASGVIHLLGPDGSTVDVRVPGDHALPATLYGGDVGIGTATLSVAGLYRVTGVDVSDTSGNTAHYTADQLVADGFATGFTVLQPGVAGQPQPPRLFLQDGAPLVQLAGSAADYRLSRANIELNVTNQPARLGDFILTAKDGTIYPLGETVGAVRFGDGQVLALQDLPTYLSGSAALSIGGAGDDYLYESRPGGYEIFVGRGGQDTLYLNGNVGDYTVRATQAGAAGAGLGVGAGLELVANNGSGALFVDASVDVVHFRNGQYLAYADIPAYVAAATPDPAGRAYVVLPDGIGGAMDSYVGGSGDTWLLLDGQAADYQLGRDARGEFTLTGRGVAVTLDGAGTVQFGNGQYLALADLPAYVAGNAVLTTGGLGDDILTVPLSGDQYVTGGQGQDALYLHGNVGDYTLKQVSVGATVYHPVVDGVELVATNGSGDIYIDRSTEVVHFQNGQYLAFGDLGAYIHA